MSRLAVQGLAVIAALTIPSLALIAWAHHIQLGGTHA
jgi:hypothetical protein